MYKNFSFDIVSNFDHEEMVIIVNQICHDIIRRSDLKESNTTISIEKETISICTNDKVKLELMKNLLLQKTIKRNLSLKIFDFQSLEVIKENRVKQQIKLRKGLNQEIIKKLSRQICDQVKKVTVTVEGESLFITGKTKNDLKQILNLLKFQDLDIVLQFENYK